MTDDHTLEEMVSRVCDEFEVSAMRAQGDIQEFLNAMLAEKLVEQVA